jgi:23S rRNA (cytidine2498-2'-O)-methyltransferase
MARLVSRLQSSTSYCLQCWSADSDAGNALIGQARELGELLSGQLQDALPQAPQLEASALLGRPGSTLVQACLIDTEQLAIGFGAPAHALSLAPAGRSRTRAQGKLPSRSARKLEEALQWTGTAPGAGELCVDLGAAPGGWTHVLASKGAKVLAVDPASLRPEVLARRNVKHVRQNAFKFEPEEPVDWLFCDMAYRPLEVAALLAKWGRQRWAQLLVANLKLPMTRKAEIVEKAREVLLAKGAWRAVRFRQLYHDRDEVTLCAHRT